MYLSCNNVGTQGFLVKSLLQVNDAHTSWKPHDLKENVVHQTRLSSAFFSMIQIQLSFAHKCFDKGQASALADQSAATQIQMQQAAMHCLFWHLSIKASINFVSMFCNSNSSFVAKRALTSNSRQLVWVPMTIAGSPVVLWWTLPTAHRGAITIWPLSKFHSSSSEFGQLTVHLLPNIYHPWHCNNIINVIHSNCQWF